MLVCFSAGDLRRLCQRLGAPELGSRPAAADVARALVRRFGRDGQLGTLVRALRDERPLVEWPEGFDTSPPDESVSPTGATSDEPDHEAEASPGPDSPAPEPTPASRQAVSRSPFIEPTAPPPRAGIDPRWFLAVSAGLGLVVILAFVLGRASTAPGETTPAPTAAPSAQAGSLAHQARSLVHERLREVARACRVDPEVADAQILSRAYAACGDSAPPIPVGSRAAADSSASSGRGLSEARPDSATHRRVEVGGALPPTAGRACLGGCDATKRACESRCGPEPKVSSAYAEHRRCLTECLRAASQCRLACNAPTAPPP